MNVGTSCEVAARESDFVPIFRARSGSEVALTDRLPQTKTAEEFELPKAPNVKISSHSRLTEIC
jgi:hypothetical protein